MERKWVIADIHGCYLTLKTLIENQLNPGNEDRVYLLGDYIDRGPRSAQCIKYVMQLQNEGLKLTPLMGNHEEGMLNAYYEEASPRKRLFFKPSNKSKAAWYEYGGKKTMESYGTDQLGELPAEVIEWMAKLNSWYEEENFLLAHAGFNFNKKNIFEDTRAMRWVRDFEVDMTKTNNRRVIHGHVPVPLELIEQFIRSSSIPYIDLDNGCVYPQKNGMGNLVALDINTMELKVQRNVDF